MNYTKVSGSTISTCLFFAVDVDDADETPVPKKQTMAEKKLDLLAKCTEAISKNKSDNQESKVSNFDS